MENNTFYSNQKWMWPLSIALSVLLFIMGPLIETYYIMLAGLMGIYVGYTLSTPILKLNEEEFSYKKVPQSPLLELKYEDLKHVTAKKNRIDIVLKDDTKTFIDTVRSDNIQTIVSALNSKITSSHSNQST